MTRPAASTFFGEHAMSDMRLLVLRWACMAMIAAALVTGCTTTVAPRAAQPSILPPDFPQTYYQQAELLGKNVWHISADQSLITIKVRRAGTLARLGHDHVVASHNIAGYVLPDEGRADFYFPLAKLSVDEPQLRAESGFDTQPTPEAIEGTRTNMLTKVLEADRFPFAVIHVTRADPASSTLRVSIMLHGTTRTFDVPARIESEPGKLRVEGLLTLHQTDFGLVPFSILGGAIQVADSLDLQFHISAFRR